MNEMISVIDPGFNERECVAPFSAAFGCGEHGTAARRRLSGG